MDTINNQPQDNPAAQSEYVKLIEIETKEGIESFRWLATQLLQVATILALANVTVVGYAAANKQAGFFLLGALLTFILLLAFAGGVLGAVPVLCRLISNEDTASLLLGRPIETGISLTLLNILGTKFLDDLREINAMTDREEKKHAMRNLVKKMLFRLHTKFGTWILILVIIIQLLIIPVLIQKFNWIMF
jgi:hypothetical protein